jgi:hypothetical protein
MGHSLPSRGDKNWHDASPLVGTLLLDLLARITLLVWGSLLFGEFYIDLDLLHISVCNYIQLIGLFPTWNSIPCNSISHKEFYFWSLFDEDTIMDHADFDCLSWKEILSLIDDYYKVNSFLFEKMS